MPAGFYAIPDRSAPRMIGKGSSATWSSRMRASQWPASRLVGSRPAQHGYAVMIITLSGNTHAQDTRSGAMPLLSAVLPPGVNEMPYFGWRCG